MKIDHVVLMASDIAASARHYGALLPLLGFRRTREWVWVNEDGFAIDLKPAEPGAPYRRRGPGLNHLSFAAPDAGAVAALRQTLLDAGLDAPEVQRIDGAHAVFLPDPDGLRIEISWEPPAPAEPAR